ncbi:hypothetical protein INS49_012359 [Diaporthe citri]|uniref:uncharacterized protein n=1 Tax=Diaporthe citri TaxID=83186 RepID=UPI001C81B149|nr:uncharacterized protein INS49_012359 [Diaporthe citri]KAG6358840.1 hypothetical protein INS49_012359 [Diaporthe citri]
MKSPYVATSALRHVTHQEITKLQLPEDRDLYSATTATILYAQGVAFSALGRVPEAEAAQKQFEAAGARVPDSRLNSIPCKQADVFGVASAMLGGELEYRKGNFEVAFSLLREAVQREDALAYSDPPPWMQPVRHALGGLLLEQGRVGEAERVFKEDLGFAADFPRRRAHPNNVWALHRLHECLVRSGKADEALPQLYDLDTEHLSDLDSAALILSKKMCVNVQPICNACSTNAKEVELHECIFRDCQYPEECTRFLSRRELLEWDCDTPGCGLNMESIDDRLAEIDRMLRMEIDLPLRPAEGDSLGSHDDNHDGQASPNFHGFDGDGTSLARDETRSATGVNITPYDDHTPNDSVVANGNVSANDHVAANDSAMECFNVLHRGYWPAGSGIGVYVLALRICKTKIIVGLPSDKDEELRAIDGGDGGSVARREKASGPWFRSRLGNEQDLA